jgi:hypothetical protein
MPDNPLREGFREVLRDPALLLMEIAWRWTFGSIAIFICTMVALVLVKTLPANPQTPQWISGMNPWDTAQRVAAVLVTIAAVLLRVGTIAVLLLAICWTCISAVGRRATLVRAAFTRGASLRACFSIHAARAVATLLALFVWIFAGVVTGFIAAATSTDGTPNLGVILLILIPALLVIVSAWSAANWYLSLAPLFSEDSWMRSARRVWRLTKTYRDEVLEISIGTGIIRVVFLIVALVLSFAVSAVVSSPRVLVLDLVAISLLYFFAADFVNIARLCAFAKLRDRERLAIIKGREAHSQPAAVLIVTESPNTATGSPEI